MIYSDVVDCCYFSGADGSVLCSCFASFNFANLRLFIPCDSMAIVNLLCFFFSSITVFFIPWGKGVKWTFHRNQLKSSCISDIYNMIRNSSKISYEVAARVIFWVITTQASVLKSQSFKKMENHRSSTFSRAGFVHRNCLT